MATIEQRTRVLVNTDPQRRCYNGCHFSSALIWGEWETIESGVDGGKVPARLAFWRDLNAYAVSCRGKNAHHEFRIKEGSAP